MVEVQDCRDAESPCRLHRRQCSRRPKEVAQHGIGSREVILGDSIRRLQQLGIRVVDDRPLSIGLDRDRGNGR